MTQNSETISLDTDAICCHLIFQRLQYIDRRILSFAKVLIVSAMLVIAAPARFHTTHIKRRSRKETP